MTLELPQRELDKLASMAKRDLEYANKMRPLIEAHHQGIAERKKKLLGLEKGNDL